MGGGLLTRLCCSRGRPGHGAAREDTQGAKVRQAAEVSRGFRVSKPAGLEVLLRPTGPKCLGRVGQPPTGLPLRPAVRGVGSRRSGLRPLARVLGEGRIAPSRTVAPRCARCLWQPGLHGHGSPHSVPKRGTPEYPMCYCSLSGIVLRPRCPIEMHNASFI